MRTEPLIHAGVESIRATEGPFEIVVAQSVGPRILGLRYEDGPQLMASLPRHTIPRDGAKPFSFHGGHRLWLAPEVPAHTYLPDDDPVAIAADERGMTVLAPVNTLGVEKSLAISVDDQHVVVDHTIVNHGDRPLQTAMWAITQLAPGGTAIIPLGSRRNDAFQADRAVIAWPYTRWDDPLLKIRDRHIEIETGRYGPTKVGTPLHREWMAYRLDGHLFVKRARHPAGAAKVDLGASGQCYCNESFLELETIGPLSTIAPGAALTHREVWEVHRVTTHSPLSRLAEDLELDRPSSLLEG